MKTCAIIIAAFDCAGYIGECLRSVCSQTPIEGWEFDIRVGIDGCEKTQRAVESCVSEGMHIDVYSAEQNSGAYIMRNSLIALHPADAYAYFDADDVMHPHYMSKMLEQIDNGHHAVMTAKHQCDENLVITNGSCIQAGGAITFTAAALGSVGGFRHFRCGCDTDFMCRLELAGIKIALINTPLYYRRKHERALTKSPIYGMDSTYRRDVWLMMSDERLNGNIKIEPVTVNLTHGFVSFKKRWW